MTHKMFFLAAFVVVASAEILPTYNAPDPPYEPPRQSYHDPGYENPHYSFQWNVDDEYSGNYYGHEETRDGYDTEGSYFVRLPDGRIQKVTYEVHGDSGFVAQVEYIGDAHYPTYPHEPTYKPKPTYKPEPTYKPPPTYKPGHIHDPDPIFHPNLDLFGRTHPRLIAE